MAAVQVETEPALDTPPTPNFSLNRVGTIFQDYDDAKESTDIDSKFYVLGSIGRLCNEVDDITLESSSKCTRSQTSSDSPDIKPIQRVPTAYDRDTPVFSWESRTSTGGTSIDDMLQKRRNPGSSLAPQSSSDHSDDEHSEAPSVGQFRPGTDSIQCPVEGCKWGPFKWKKNLHHHIRDKHPTDAVGLSVMRIQPAHVGAAHNGYRLQSVALAPTPVNASVPSGGDPSLTCPECGKTFPRKGDLVHHKRYHTRSNDRPYKCEICGQGFIHHKDLARHMPRHTGQRSFQCPFPDCSKNYTRKDNLNRHVRHDHGGLNVSGEVWTGVEAMTGSELLQIAAQPAPLPLNLPVSQSQPRDPHFDHSSGPSVPVSSHLTAIAEAASNHALLQESNVQQHTPMFTGFAEQHDHPDAPPAGYQSPNLQQDSKMDSSSSEPSVPARHISTPFAQRETTPSLGKRPAEPIADLERLATGGLKPKRKPKEKWAHRLGCPFRKCRPNMFTTERGYRVCETTPHEFIIRLIEHMKRNHELFVCGECFLGFSSPDALGVHKNGGPNGNGVHHCGKCYLSFGDEASFIAHAAGGCPNVDAATQEDIWQILYETLCGDGVRHSPSFDEDDEEMAADGNNIIRPSNHTRMRILAERDLAPGQVPSLSRQMASPSPQSRTPTSGNATAPPVVQQGDGSSSSGHHSVPEGAWSPQAPQKRRREDRTYTPPTQSANTAPHPQAIQVLTGMLAAERTARVQAEQRLERLITRRKEAVVKAAAQRFVANVQEKAEEVQLAVHVAHNAFDSSIVGALPGTRDSLSQALCVPYQDFNLEFQHCPSLTSSEETEPSVADSSFVVPTSITRSLTAIVADLVKSDANTNDRHFIWDHSISPWDCQHCGAHLSKADDVFCEICTRAHT